MGRLRKKPQKITEQYDFVDDTKLRMSLIYMADTLDESIRSIIYATYNDPELLAIYRAWRDSGDFELGGKSKVYRESIRFPNPYVYDFCKTIFEPEHGSRWYADKKIWGHELIKPWLLVKTY